MWDFSQEVTDINQVPEQFRSVYVSGEGDNEGKIIIGEQFTHLTEAIVGLNGSLVNSRQEARDATAAIKPWQALGENPEAVSSSMSQLATDRDDALAKNKSFDPQKMRDDMQKEWEGKVTEATEGSAQLKGELKHALISSAAVSAISKHNGEERLLMPIIRDHVQMVPDAKTGKQVVQVIDSEGMVRYSATTSNLMTVDELVAEMKASRDYGMAFKSNLKDGSGQPGDGRRVMHGKDSSKMTANEKIAAGFGD